MPHRHHQAVGKRDKKHQKPEIPVNARISKMRGIAKAN
jgi:hypothetical protein